MNIPINHPTTPSGEEPAAAGSPARRAPGDDPSTQAAAGGVGDPSRYLIAKGFQPGEAGNLTAFLYGLAPVEGGWTVEEIERLLFVRHLVEREIVRS